MSKGNSWLQKCFDFDFDDAELNNSSRQVFDVKETMMDE